MGSKTFTLGSELVQLYSRKSQVDFLLKSVLSHIWESQKEITLPHTFTSSLKESFSQLPGDTVIDIWTIINKELLDHYHSVDEMVVQKFESVGELMSLFLKNISVDDVPERTANGIKSQLKETTEYLFNHLKTKCFDQKCTDDCVVVLFRVLLARTVFLNLLPGDCTIWRVTQPLSEIKIEPVWEFNDLSPLYPHFTAKQWKKIHRLVNKSEHRKLIIVWEHLLVQGLKWCQSHAANSGKNSLRQRQLCDYLILQKLGHFDVTCDLEWNGELSSVTEENYDVAVWSLLCENLSCMLPQNSSGRVSPYDTAVSRILVSMMLTKSSTSVDRKNISLQMVTPNCIKCWHSSGFSGLEMLQSTLLSAVLGSMSKLFCGNMETRTKRIKGHAVVDAVRRVLLLLEDAPPGDEVLLDESRVLWPSDELFALVNELLQSAKIDMGVTLDSGIANEAINSLQILRDVLLPCLNNPDDVQSNVDRFRCLVVALAFLAVKSDCSLLIEICLDIVLGAITEGQGVQFILLGVDVNDFLSFICSISDYIHQQSISDHSIKKVDKIFALVLRNVFQQPRSIQEFNAFIKDTVSDLNKLKEKTKQSPEQRLKPVAWLVACMESIHKILHRSYVRPDIEPLLTHVNSTLVKEFDGLLQDFCRSSKATSSCKHCLSDDSTMSQEDAVIPYLLSGYVCQLDEILGRPGAKDHITEEKEDNGVESKLKKVLKALPALCQGCMQCFRLSKNSDVTRRCLDFVNFICLHLHVSSKSLPADFLSSVWTLLVDVLRRDLGSVLSPIDQNGSIQTLTNGNISTQKSDAKSLRRTIAVLTSVFELEEFEQHLELLLSDLKSCSSGGDTVHILAALQIVQELTEQSVSVDCQSSFYVSCQKLLFQVQLILLNCKDIQVKLAVLQTETRLISLGPSFLESSELSLCLGTFADIHLEAITDLGDFVTMFNESYSVLNALLQYQATAVHKAIPAYLCVVKKLLRSVMKRSHQDQHKNLDSAQLNRLDECARLIYRLAHLMLEHKIDFAKVAPYLVAEYVTELQKGTLYPIIKKTLLMAVYQWLDMCSDYATAHLYRVLPFGAREIFRYIHEDFERYHRYKGRS